MASTSTPSLPTKRQARRRLFDYAPTYWVDVSPGSTVTALPDTDLPLSTADAEPAAVSDTPVCHTCAQTHDTFVAQRAHFRTDWHKYNLQRRVRGRPPLSELDFDALSDLGSLASLSGSEPEPSDEEAEPTPGPAAPTARLAEKLEFREPQKDDAEGGFLVLYRAALPDQASLASLVGRGAWAVIMAGGGHFCAALWDVKGVMVRHKTFHRYTSRRKQGGSQAAADEARGAANRIKSAGATLRRYGEQALQKEVHALLKEWYNDLVAAQCIFVRASQREKRDLLMGWNGSPLKEASEKDAVRNIPIPTRRATLKEAKRVYEELSTVRVSSVSLVESADLQQKAIQEKAKDVAHSAVAPSDATPQKKPQVKGTDHLKKREEKDKKVAQLSEAAPQKEEQPPPIDEELAGLLKLCIDSDKETLFSRIRENESLSGAVFEPHYFTSDARFAKIDSALGLVGVAAVCGDASMVEELMKVGVSPAIGASPYVSAKSKAVRTLFRKYWGAHPDQFDYAAAGIPGPLTEDELRDMAEKEKARRRKDREKKKERAREKAEAAKPPEQRARELRAAAAEARLLGNRCAGCRKSLQGLVPFERLAFKYCSTECVSKHRQVLSNM